MERTSERSKHFAGIASRIVLTSGTEDVFGASTTCVVVVVVIAPILRIRTD
jgi:predicted alpha/beta-hydrolase family hydrolase